MAPFFLVSFLLLVSFVVNEQCSQFRPCQPQSIDPFFIHQYFLSRIIWLLLAIYSSSTFFSSALQFLTVPVLQSAVFQDYSDCDHLHDSSVPSSSIHLWCYRLSLTISSLSCYSLYAHLCSFHPLVQTIESHLLPFLEYLQTHTYLHSIHTLSIYGMMNSLLPFLEPSLSLSLLQSLSKFKESAPFTLIVNDKPIVDFSSQDYQQKYTHLLELYHHLQSSYQTLLTTPKVHQHHHSSSSTTIQPPPVPMTPPPVSPLMPTNSPPVSSPMLTNPPPVYPPMPTNPPPVYPPNLSSPQVTTNSHRVDSYPSGIQRNSQTTFMRGPTIPGNQSTEQGPLSDSSPVVARSIFPSSEPNYVQKEYVDYNKTKVIYAYNDSYKYTHIASSSLYDYYYTPTTATLFYKYINEYKFTNVEFLFLASISLHFNLLFLDMNIMDSGFISFCNCMRSLALPSLKCGYFQSILSISFYLCSSDNNIGYEGMNALVNMYKDLHAKRSIHLIPFSFYSYTQIGNDWFELYSFPFLLSLQSSESNFIAGWVLYWRTRQTKHLEASSISYSILYSPSIFYFIYADYQIRNPSLLSYANKNNQNFLILSNELFCILIQFHPYSCTRHFL